MGKPANDDDVERQNKDRLTSKCGKSGRFGNSILGLDPAKTLACFYNFITFG